MIKLSDYIFKYLAERGIKHVFMLPGGGAMHLVDSLGNSPIQYICNLHEQACAIAASSYAQYTGDIGVALVTTGPGGTNTITGVAGAWLDSIPCLFISGQVKRADLKTTRGVRQMGFQEIDITKLVASITKYAVMVTSPETIRYHLEKAIFLAKSGRPGPVWLDIPLDVQATEVDEERLAGFVSPKPSKVNNELLVKQVADTIALLNKAERPVILVGNGVRLAGARDDFLKLIDILQVPVLTTWKAIDFLEEKHPLFAGRPGITGQRGANFTQQNSDWFLSIGARLDFGQIGYSHKNFARLAKKIIVDIDKTEIDKLMTPVDVAVKADASEFIREMLVQAVNIKPNDRKSWLSMCKEWQAKYPVVLPEYRQEKDYVNNYVLVDVLSEEMSGEDILVPGSSGASSEITMQAFRVKPGMRIFNTQGLGPMGFGASAAIGGCLASGSKLTVCIDGDGGFAMNIQELETIKRLNLPIKIFVLNNQGYGSIRNTQRAYFKGHLVASDAGSGLTLPDINKIANSFGIHATRIINHDHINQKVREILDYEGPAICEVMISPDQCTAPRVTSAQRPDGTMVSKPLEDMWPFLSRGEFRSNMIVSPIDE